MFKPGWKVLLGIIISLVILTMAYLEREFFLEAFSLVKTIRLDWLLLAFGVMLLSFLVMSQVFQVALRLQGYRMSVFRLWAMALVSIILSQSIPAGGVWSYAFMVNTFKRRGLPAGHAALVATMDVLSYGVTMLLLVVFGMIYMAFHNLTTEGGSYLAAAIALLMLSVIIYVLTRREKTLKAWALTIKGLIERIIRHSWSNKGLLHLISEIVHGRQMLLSRPQDVLLLIPIQLLSLSGHSLAMLIVLMSMGVDTTFLVVLTAFSIALLTSSFNLLPGGGGTVETAIVAVLYQMGVGPAALPAAIIFRLLNFWLMLPIAGTCYYWLTSEKPPRNKPVRDFSHTHD